MITDRLIDQAYSDLHSTHGGLREDYFGLLYLEREHKVPRSKALNQVAFGGNDYGFDGFHFDEDRRNLYLFQFKYSDSPGQFKATARVRILLSALMEHPDYRDKVAEGNLSFLRTDRAFEECMELAHKKWRWVHKKLA